MNRKTVASQRIFRACAFTVELVHRMQQTPVVLGLMSQVVVKVLCYHRLQQCLLYFHPQLRPPCHLQQMEL